MKGRLPRNANIDLGLAILASTSEPSHTCRTSLHTVVVHVRPSSKLSKKLFANSGQHSTGIKRQLLLDTTKWGHCAIYENELQRIWPLNEENRKAKIEQFAKEYGFCLSFYRPGVCAIFEKERDRQSASHEVLGNHR
jgi:hypothetical protein